MSTSTKSWNERKKVGTAVLFGVRSALRGMYGLIASDIGNRPDNGVLFGIRLL